MPPTSRKRLITCRPESASAAAARRTTCRASRWSSRRKSTTETAGGDKKRKRGVKPLVLIVEDREALVTMLRYNLESSGFRVNAAGDGRSEEHTSELQSLMRISYAVFCL